MPERLHGAVRRDERGFCKRGQFIYLAQGQFHVTRLKLVEGGPYGYAGAREKRAQTAAYRPIGLQNNAYRRIAREGPAHQVLKILGNLWPVAQRGLGRALRCSEEKLGRTRE